MELLRLDTGGIAEDVENLDAARRAKDEERLRGKMARPMGSKASESSQPGAFKGRKGKEKGSSKGKTEEAGKGKNQEGKKDEQWRKK